MQSLQEWVSDWRNPALLLALVALLYLARLPAERLIRALFGFAGRALRLLDRWIAAGGIAAMAHYDRLKAHLAAEEPNGGHSTGTRFVFAARCCSPGRSWCDCCASSPAA